MCPIPSHSSFPKVATATNSQSKCNKKSIGTICLFTLDLECINPTYNMYLSLSHNLAKLTLCSVREPATVPGVPAATGVGFTEEVGIDAMGLEGIGGTGGGTEGGGPAVEEGCGAAGGGGGGEDGGGAASVALASAVGFSVTGSAFFGGASPARNNYESMSTCLSQNFILRNQLSQNPRTRNDFHELISTSIPTFMKSFWPPDFMERTQDNPAKCTSLY